MFIHFNTLSCNVCAYKLLLQEHIKAFALEVLLEERDKSIRDLLAEGIRSIAEVDFPVRWPGLLDLLLQVVAAESLIVTTLFRETEYPVQPSA
jgi:hypothetical protein